VDKRKKKDERRRTVKETRKNRLQEKSHQKTLLKDETRKANKLIEK
jgi:hypothetical protein